MLHHLRVHIEADFGELIEEHELPGKLSDLEALCQEQGITDGDVPADSRQEPGWLQQA
jgi:hypothetical protein